MIAMSMIFWHHSEFNILSFNSNKFDLKNETLLIRHLLNIETFLKDMCCIIL